MPYLSPPTLTRDEVESLLIVTRLHPRDHLTIALALGTGLRLSAIVGLNVGDVYPPEGRRGPGQASCRHLPRAAAPATCSCPMRYCRS